MANNPARYGFRWHSSLQGTSHPKPVRGRVASALSSSVSPGPVTCNLNVGDPVKMVNDGTFAMCASGDAVYGIIEGFWAQSFNGNLPAYLPFLDNLPSGTTWSGLDNQIFLQIVPAAGQIFEAICDDNVTAVLETTYITYIGENVDYVFVPDTASKQARPVLDISTHATTSTLAWRIHDLAKRVDVDYTGTNVPLHVTCNKVQQSPYQLTGV